MTDNFPRIGLTAKPGRAFRADIDQMPIRVIRGMVPRPVLYSHILFNILGLDLTTTTHPPQKVQCFPHGEIRQGGCFPARGGSAGDGLIETQIAAKENKNKRKNYRILICDNLR